MPFLNSLNISGSGLSAQKLRMDIISQNIANAETTRTDEGGPYLRKSVVFYRAGGDLRFNFERQAGSGRSRSHWDH